MMTSFLLYYYLFLFLLFKLPQKEKLGER